MSVNEDFVQSSSDSFWEVGKYMRTVKRCDNGFQLCNHLRKLIEERSEIERKYSVMLAEWSKKWNNFLDKGPEYGTTQGAWRGALTESDQVADLHTNMADKLMSSVHSAIKVWQKDNYHKSMMHFKETKDFEDSFRKVQKPWGKRLSKVQAAKKEYHAACRAEKSMANQENNARGDSTVSQDQLTKLQDKLRKCQQEVDSTREKYNAAINDINSYNPKYIEDMTEVYNKCQEFEHKRIDFFKKIMYDIHACLDLSVDAKYSQIYTSLHATIGNQDANKDLKWWSTNYGVEMHMNWPDFEEYSPGLQAIVKRGKANVGTADGGITITKIKHSREDSYGSYTNEQPQQPTAPAQQQPPQQQFQSQSSTQAYSTQVSNNSFGATTSNSDRKESYNQSLNPFGDDEEEEEEEGEEEENSIAESREDDEKDVEGRLGKSLDATSTESDTERHKNHESPVNNGENPFGDPEHDHDNDFADQDSSEEPPSDGWVVRALYSYTKAEDDELELNVGDVFKQIAVADEMGWCKGQKNGVEGFFPKNYVERI